MRNTVGPFQALNALAIVFALSAVTIAGCSGGSRSLPPAQGAGDTGVVITAPGAPPPIGRPYIVAQARDANGAASSNRARRTSTAWNSQTVDTCFTNNVCEVQTFPASSWGVTVACNGNTGCQQSTFSPTVLGGPKDVSITFSPATIAPGTWSWSTITVGATEKPGPLPESISFTVVSGPGPGPGNLNLQTQVLCAVSVLNACPKLEIVDQNLPGTPVVSGSPPPKQQTVVGRQASLLVRPNALAGSGLYSLSNPTWNIPGYTAKDYQFSGATPEPIGYWTDRLSAQLAFFWYLPQDNQPAVTGTVTRIDKNESADLQAMADYNVQMPTAAASITTHPARENTGQRADGGTAYWLSCGLPTNPCVNFSFKVSNDVGFPGTIVMNQLISQTESLTDSQNHVTNVNHGPPPELDNYPMYEPAVATSATWKGLDAPGIGLVNTYVSATTAYTFSDTFMYKPNDHGFWVPLLNGTWTWSAGATITNVPSNVWCVDGTVVNHVACPGAAARMSSTTPSGTEYFPSWTITYQNISAHGRHVESKWPHTTPLLSPP